MAQSFRWAKHIHTYMHSNNIPGTFAPTARSFVQNMTWVNGNTVWNRYSGSRRVFERRGPVQLKIRMRWVALEYSIVLHGMVLYCMVSIEYIAVLIVLSYRTCYHSHDINHVQWWFHACTHGLLFLISEANHVAQTYDRQRVDKKVIK